MNLNQIILLKTFVIEIKHVYEVWFETGMNQKLVNHNQICIDTDL